MGCFCFSGIRQALKNHICILWGVFFAITGLRINIELLLLPCAVTVDHQIILQLLHLVITLNFS